jgi:uncharacterized protein YcbK (DUF882 family)
MPLASSAKLAPNFTAHELGADKPAATDQIVENLRRTAAFLQALRDLFNRRVYVTSGFRPPVENEQVGGAPTSDHPHGLAADFEVEGLTPYEVYRQLMEAKARGKLPAFDQIIFYAIDSHVHVGLGARMRGELLLKTAEGPYVQLAGAWLAKLRGFV